MIYGNTISSSSGAINITPFAGSSILLDGAIDIDAGVITGATSITSTAFIGDVTGNVTGNISGDVTVGIGNTLDVSAGTLTLAAGQITADKVSAGTFNAGATYSFNGSTIPAGEGTLVSLTFDYDGDADICLETVVLSDSNGDPISVGVGECATTEVTAVMGDVNYDGQINVSDIIIIVNMILGSEPSNYATADINNDNEINVQDIIFLINIILAE